MNAPVSSDQHTLFRFVLRIVAVMVVVSMSAIGFGHAASLGGLGSDELLSFKVDGTIPPPPATTTIPPPTTLPPTTLPPIPSGNCGDKAADPNLPCVIPAGEVITKPVKWNSDVIVLGEVDANLKVTGGTITLGPTGIVRGNVNQSGPGGVVIAAGGTVDGQVIESGDGSVFIDGTVGKNVEERDAGDLVIGTNGLVRRNVSEFGAGSLTVQGTVDGDALEYGAGNLTVSGVVHGIATESGEGSLTISGTVDGRVTELGNGDLTVGGLAVIGNGVDARPGGVCVIAPTATVNGPRLGDCA